MPYADKTTLNNLSPNLAPQQVAASGLRLAVFQYLYSLSDQNYAEMQALVSGGALQLYPLGVTRQALINGGFKVNQRVVSGTVTLAAGAYGHDRWKAGSGGCTYTFSTANNVTTITITAGSLVQVIDGINLYSGTYTLSWTGTAQGKIGAGSFGATGITAIVTGGTNLSIEFNAGTLSNVQFNLGSSAVSFQPRSFAEELELCRRYFRIIGNGAVGKFTSATSVTIYGTFDKPMRVNPTITLNTTTPSIDEIGIASRNATAATLSVGADTNGYGGAVIAGFSGGTAGNMVALRSNCLNVDAEI